MEKKNTKFSRAGGSAPDPRNRFHCRLLATRLSRIMLLYCYCLCHQSSMPPKFSLMLHLKSIIFYQNKPKIKLVLQNIKFFKCWGHCPQTPNCLWRSSQTPKHNPSPHCRFLITRLTLDVCCSYFQVLDSYNEKLLS